MFGVGLAALPGGYDEAAQNYWKRQQLEEDQEARKALGAYLSTISGSSGVAGPAPSFAPGMGGSSPFFAPSGPSVAPAGRELSGLSGAAKREAAAINAGTWQPAPDYEAGLALAQPSLENPPVGGVTMGGPGAAASQILSPDVAPVGANLTPAPVAFSGNGGLPGPALPGQPPGLSPEPGGPVQMAQAAPQPPVSRGTPAQGQASGGGGQTQGAPPTWQDLARNIARANPGISPQVLSRAVQAALPLMQTDSQMWFRTLQAELARERMANQAGIAGANRESRETIAGQRPEVELLRRYYDVHPNATPEEAAQYMQSTRGSGQRSPASVALQKFLTENPSASAQEIQAFTNQPAFIKQERQIEATGQRQERGIQSREGIAAAGREAAGQRQDKAIQSRENMAKQSLEFKTEAFNRAFAQKEAQFQQKFDLARQKIDSGQMSDTDSKTVAQAIANYRQAPYTGIAARSGAAVKIMSEVYRLNPEYDAANWRQHSDAMTRFGTGVQGNTIRSLRVADDHLQTLGNLADQLNNQDTKSFNTVKNFLNKQFGYPEVPNFDAARQIVAAEVIKAVSATGGGVAERLQAQQPIDVNASLAQITGAIRTYRRLMAGQLKGFQSQYESIPGNPKDFQERFKLNPAELTRETPASQQKNGGWKIEVIPGG